MGSVKDLDISKAPTDNEPGQGCFNFSDRYSVFDWGEMPDHIPHKGEALCLITAYFFEKLEEKGIKTHYRGIKENGKTKKLSELNHPSGQLEVLLVRVKEAKKIAGLNDKELSQAQELLAEVNNLITREVKQAGLKNLDGKIELAFDSNRELMVVDAVGTPDECRFAYNGFSISKEAVRKYYRQTEWHQEVTQAKKNYGKDWKQKVATSPEPLPEKILDLISQLYMVCTNEVTGIQWFDDISSFSEIRSQLQEIT